MTGPGAAFGLVLLALLCACSPTDPATRDNPFAPDVNTRAQGVDNLTVGHRLMDAGEYELAIAAFNRAAAEDGLNAEVLSSLGTANLKLGRLNQSEKLLRRAVDEEDAWPEIWNNLGVVLMERGKTAEAEQIFRKAYALDNGESDSIRDNLRLALAKRENPAYDDELEQDYKLVRRGSSDFLISRTP